MDTNAVKSIPTHPMEPSLQPYNHRNLTDRDMNAEEDTPKDNATTVLKRSTSADSVLMADSYQVIGGSSAHTYGLRSDQCTQTPEEWEESDKSRFDTTLKEHKTESVQNTAPLRRIDARLVSNKDQSTQSIECDSYKATQALVTSGVSPVKWSLTKSGPITIPTKLCVESSRSANSLEELNQEIENLVLKGIHGFDNQCICDKIPEGHRAPVFELLAVKAQKMNCVGSGSGEDSSDLSQSESPVFATEIISTADTCDTQNHNNNNYSMSPKINKFLTREPPDGCEKIRIVNEDDRLNAINCQPNGGFVCPVQPSSGFVLLPSRSSAFLPIFKPND
ncbi:unnamed protein product, partial [Oppiella nova]